MIKIPLRGKYAIGEFAFAYIDDEDFALVDEYGPWYAFRTKVCKNGEWQVYAWSNSGGYMHRLIMNAGEDEQVDHVDHCTLQNLRDNMRLCSHSQNNLGRLKVRAPRTSDWIGVCFFKGRWIAQIQLGGGTRETRKCHFISAHPDQRSALLAREQFVRQLIEEHPEKGEFVTLNCPEITDYSSIVYFEREVTSEYPGVSLKAFPPSKTGRRVSKGRKEWRARLILSTGKEEFFGNHYTQLEAHIVVETARVKHYPNAVRCACMGGTRPCTETPEMGGTRFKVGAR